MTYISQTFGYTFLALFGIGMLLFTLFSSKRKHATSKEGLLVADRNVSWVSGAFSIAASWIWAPALFVSVQFAYQMGLAGVFWFTVPNIIALALFALFAPKIRKKFPGGFTLPQYIEKRLGSKRVHKIYLVPYVFY